MKRTIVIPSGSVTVERARFHERPGATVFLRIQDDGEVCVAYLTEEQARSVVEAIEDVLAPGRSRGRRATAERARRLRTLPRSTEPPVKIHTIHPLPRGRRAAGRKTT